MTGEKRGEEGGISIFPALRDRPCAFLSEREMRKKTLSRVSYGWQVFIVGSATCHSKRDRQRKREKEILRI